ncbi:MAG: hypothetical protein J5I81_03795 [Nitrococcus mobilis]|nr:hypothetical protein [Nitrococcus mobilis]
MAELPTKACWEAEDARIILANEALERNDPVFLATHSPVEGYQVGGSHSSDITEHTEQGLLDALSASSNHHAFCVVEGEPGSGKSHLIRWLAVRWPKDESLQPLLIQRLDGSLQGTLQQLQRALPEEHQHLFEQIGRPQDRTLAGRAGLFLKTLAQSLRPNFFVNPPEDAEWCERFGLAEILDDTALVDQWKAPERIIELLSGKKGKRDQELARFNLQDMAELEQLIRPLGAPTPRAVRFKNELKKEAQAIRQLAQQELVNPAAQEDLRRRFDYSYKLVDALNERHNSAVQNVLGISTDGLKELFLRLRRELRDRRLVLLLEDITAWEGVDRQLIDVLVTNVETRQDQDLCPMISVVGVTPAYFQNRSFKANYTQRITHHIRLGDPSDTQNYQDVSALRAPESQIAFAAKYLRATRAGVQQLTEWDGGPDPVPNRCNTCRHKDPCHREFGNHEGVGLFPFTEQAIIRLYGLLRDPQHMATYQTPRGMLQGVLSPTMQHPLDLEAGEYPGPEIETDLIPEDERKLFDHGQLADVLEVRIDDSRIRERVRRLVAYWGVKGTTATSTLADGEGALVYGGVRQGIYQALDLPWLGDETPGGVVAPTQPDPNQPVVNSPTSPNTGDGGSGGSARPGRQDQGETARRRMPDGPRRMTATQLVRVKQDIGRWVESKSPERPTELNRLAYEILDRLNWTHLEVTPWIRSRVFTEDTVILRDTKPARGPYLILDREPWVAKGIGAYQALRAGTDDMPDQEIESYRRNYATIQRKLGSLVCDKVRERLPSLKGGITWEILGTAAQILLARAWLRGNVPPLADSWEQWRAVIRDEGEAVSNPQDRVDSWSALVDATGGSHGVLRKLLRRSLNLPEYQPDPEQDKDTSLAHVDYQLVAALANSPQTFQTLPQPSSLQGLGEKLSELKRLAEIAGEVNKQLKNIPRYETERLAGRAKFVERVSRGSSIRQHILRVDKVVEEIARHFPNNVAEPVQAWRKVRQDLENQGFLADGVDCAGATVEQFMDRVSDGDVPKPEDRAQALSWTLEAPANALRVANKGFEVAEDTVGRLLAYVEEYLEGASGGGGTIEQVRETGVRIQQAADKAINGLEEASNG